MSGRALRLLPALILVAAATGCLERQGRPVAPCTVSSVGETIQVESVDKVDLLFMVDNSNSMGEEQASLAAQFPRMIRILVSGDFNQDGDNDDDVDFDPVRDLNVGVITSDMGTGGFTVPTCARSQFGDDGILRTQGNTGDPSCSPTYPSFLNYNMGATGPIDQFASSFACVAQVGVGGCGFEQQLEATLKAASPNAAQAWTAGNFNPPIFFGNTFGHGAEQTFIRDNSVLGLILVTDEEDCSAADPEIFNPMSTVYTGDLNLRCFNFARQAVHPIERYVNGFLQLRRSAGLLVYAAITGIPVDLAPATPDQAVNYQAILDDPRMREEVDATMPNRLTPSCNVPGRGLAFPPRRIVQVAQQLEAGGAGVTVQSICQEDFGPALQSVIRKIANALGQACLPRQLNRNADGSVDCDVVATMPSGQDCGSLQNGCATCDPVTPDPSCAACPQLDDNGAPVISDGRAVCVMRQLVARGAVPSGAGWYYDDFSADVTANCSRFPSQQRIAFTNQPATGTEVRLECLQNILAGRGAVTVGTFCEPTSSDPNQNPCAGAGYTCDDVTRACGVQCNSDADCRSAELVGFQCDQRPKGEVDPMNFPGDTTPYNYCVNATCN
ncbi:MAG: hypothetical protein K8H88_18345 [Sandaracinaceae bacterium]|nr:hypothetical protein [Sandaracinaceae bacterium]